MSKRIKPALCTLLAVLLLVSSFAVPAAFAADSATATGLREVRVAYPIQQNLSELDENGNYDGYLTEYLEMIAEIAGWKITYLTYSDLSSDDQMMQALEDVKNGDADLLGGLLYNDALAEQYLYPKNSCGAVYTTLETLETNYRLKDTNYMETPILRVAILKNATARNQEVAQFAENMGLTCEYISCETREEQIAALENETADVMTNVSLTFLPGMKTLASFSPRPYYYVTGQGGEDLIEELDAALEKIDRTAPYFQTRLQSEYFSTTLTQFTLSEQERAYVAEHDAIEVLVCPRHAPLSFLNSKGELCGIAVSIMDEIGKTIGVEIHYHQLEAEQNLQEQMATGQYDLLIGPPNSSEFAIDNRLIASNQYLETNLTMFVNKAALDKPQSECVRAVNREFPVLSGYPYESVKYRAASAFTVGTGRR